MSTEWISDIEESVAIVVLIKVVAQIVGWTELSKPPGRIPVAAIGLFGLVAIPTAIQFIWHPVLGALERDPNKITEHHQYWRMVTSMVVQDGGAEGALFNLVSLAIIAAMAVWFWGSHRAIVTFLIPGLMFNVVALLYGSSGAGNSGATFGLVASIAGYTVIRGTGALRTASAIAVGIGPVIWALGNLHGMAVLGGGLVGATYALSGVQAQFRLPRLTVAAR